MLLPKLVKHLLREAIEKPAFRLGRRNQWVRQIDGPARHSYSYLSATIGSIRIALRAGM